jgi:hypothetical protein
MRPIRVLTCTTPLVVVRCTNIGQRPTPVTETASLEVLEGPEGEFIQKNVPPLDPEESVDVLFELQVRSPNGHGCPLRVWVTSDRDNDIHECPGTDGQDIESVCCTGCLDLAVNVTETSCSFGPREGGERRL